MGSDEHTYTVLSPWYTQIHKHTCTNKHTHALKWKKPDFTEDNFCSQHGKLAFFFCYHHLAQLLFVSKWRKRHLSESINPSRLLLLASCTMLSIRDTIKIRPHNTICSNAFRFTLINKKKRMMYGVIYTTTTTKVCWEKQLASLFRLFGRYKHFDTWSCLFCFVQLLIIHMVSIILVH